MLKILLISDECINPVSSPNNFIQNLFLNSNNFDILNLFLSNGTPETTLTNKFIQISDSDIIKSLFFPLKKAGKFINTQGINSINQNKNINSIINFISLHFKNDFTRFIKGLFWQLGSINIKLLKEEIFKFSPDIIFFPRYTTFKTLKIEKIIYRLTKKKLIVFTGDNELKYGVKLNSIIKKIHVFFLRKKFKNNLKYYSKYLFLDRKMEIEYNQRFNFTNFNINSKTILSPINSRLPLPNYNNQKIYSFIYAGKLYLGRKKSLLDILEFLSTLNLSNLKFSVYTSSLTQKESMIIENQFNFCKVFKPVPHHELIILYKNHEFSLYIESKDPLYSTIVKNSISTKINDLISSGTAIISYGNDDQAGINYLSRHNATFNINSNKKDFLNLLTDNLSISNLKNASLRLMIKHQKYDILEDLK